MKLLVHLTDDCNLNCSFCNRRNDPKRKEIDTLPVIKALHKVKPIANIQLSGGEPLLVKDKLYYFINELKGVAPIQVLTNGHFVDEEFVRTCNDNDIHVRVSLNGIESGEKNLKNLLKTNPDGLKLLRNIKNLSIRQIVDIRHYFANSSIALLKTFGCRLEIGFDYFSLNAEDIGAIEMFNFIEQIDKIKQFDKRLFEHVSFINFPYENCECSDNYVLYIDGTLERYDERFDVEADHKGCALISSLMGRDNYDILLKLINEIRR
ncbi:radical SAM protein [Deferribacter abyssi]|uniref:radical SAM protein n=1 Tax=Deferribacter abyssi TaxID=213806 RepID=UPI003C1C9282